MIQIKCNNLKSCGEVLYIYIYIYIYIYNVGTNEFQMANIALSHDRTKVSAMKNIVYAIPQINRGI